MGEIAEMLIEGQMCKTCGHIFREEVGYPRECKDCIADGDHHDDAPTTKDLEKDCDYWEKLK